jgi:uncharacterized protein YjiS (DUF1127 family)
MTGCHDMQVRRSDGRRLTAEQWDSFKRCAEDARAQAMRALVGGVLASLPRAVLEGGRIVRSLGRWAGASARKAWRAYVLRRQRRAAIRELSALDDRMLWDIGLGRSEIQSVVHDPERILARQLRPGGVRQRVGRADVAAGPKSATEPAVRPMIDKTAA